MFRIRNFIIRRLARSKVLKSEHSKLKARNIVGPIVRRLRNALELSQADLAARCSLLGWDLSRETVAKIESQIRWVADFELMCLAAALRVDVPALLPAKPVPRTTLAEWFS